MERNYESALLWGSMGPVLTFMMWMLDDQRLKHACGRKIECLIDKTSSPENSKVIKTCRRVGV